MPKKEEVIDCLERHGLEHWETSKGDLCYEIVPYYYDGKKGFAIIVEEEEIEPFKEELKKCIDYKGEGLIPNPVMYETEGRYYAIFIRGDYIEK